MDRYQGWKKAKSILWWEKEQAKYRGWEKELGYNIPWNKVDQHVVRRIFLLSHCRHHPVRVPVHILGTRPDEILEIGSDTVPCEKGHFSTYPHQLCKEPSGRKPDWKRRCWQYSVASPCTPCRNWLCILQVHEAKQQSIHVNFTSAKYLHLTPPVGKEIPLRPPVKCAVETELAQCVC